MSEYEEIHVVVPEYRDTSHEREVPVPCKNKRFLSRIDNIIHFKKDLSTVRLDSFSGGSKVLEEGPMNPLLFEIGAFDTKQGLLFLSYK